MNERCANSSNKIDSERGARWGAATKTTRLIRGFALKMSACLTRELDGSAMIFGAFSLKMPFTSTSPES